MERNPVPLAGRLGVNSRGGTRRVHPETKYFGDFITMRSHTGRRFAASSSLLLLFLFTGWVYGKRKPTEVPLFLYEAGTENLARGCGGKLEVLKDALAFTCPQGSVTMPFSAITLMQYRPDVSKQVVGMNIDWKVRPALDRARDNIYFTVLCNENGKTRAVVLRVDVVSLRPYLAEIELKSGKNVQVYRSYDETD